MKTINIYKEYLAYQTSAKLYKFILIYLLFGAWVVISNNSNMTYIEILNLSTISGWMLSYFCLPVLIFVIHKNFSIIENNDFLELRFRNEKDYLQFQIKSMILLIMVTLGYYFMFVLILANLYADRINFFDNDTLYGVPNLVLFLFNFFKLIIFSIGFGLLNIYMKKHFKIYALLIVNFLFIFSIFDPTIFKYMSLFKYLMPGDYINPFFPYSSFSQYIAISGGYVVVFLMLSLLFVTKNRKLREN